MAQRVGRGLALLFLDCGTRRGGVVSSTPRPQFTPGKEPVPILQEAAWAAVSVWTGGKSRPHRDSIPDPPARSQSLYQLSYPAHALIHNVCQIVIVKDKTDKISSLFCHRTHLFLYQPLNTYFYLLNILFISAHTWQNKERMEHFCHYNFKN